MKLWKGTTLSQGIAAGEIFFYSKTPARRSPEKGTPEQEEERFQNALERAKQQQREFSRRMTEQGDADSAAVFDIHEMLLEDEDYGNAVQSAIRSGKSAAEAVHEAGEQFRETFAAMDDEYFRARATDFVDISACIEEFLCPEIDPLSSIGHPVILAAEELTPSETVRLPRENIAAFVTVTGSQTSHTAILARNMGIPAISGVPADASWTGLTAIIDGEAQTLVLSPGEEELSAARERIALQKKQTAELEALRGAPTVTSDGRRVKLCANIGKPNDIKDVLNGDAEGIGLFRTEFMFLGRRDLPDENEQFAAYRKVIEAMKGNSVVIRTLDVGADKQAECLSLTPEPNPALGCRAIRMCLQRPALFKTQLRAVLRAGVYGSAALMFPLISSEKEVIRALELLEEAKRELAAEGTPYALDEIGIMIETPAAAIMSDVLAKHVDFFSIGTNDLTQYTLAADRQNPQIDAMIDPHDPALLRLIALTVKNGHAGGCWVGICGELGGDPTLTKQFVDMGVDELSVSPRRILPLRAAIRKL